MLRSNSITDAVMPIAKQGKQKYLPKRLTKRMWEDDNPGDACFIFAAEKSYIERTKSRIMKYIDKYHDQPQYLNALQSRERNSDSIFSWAVDCSHWDIVDHMLDLDGVDVNHKTMNGRPPLLICLERLINDKNVHKAPISENPIPLRKLLSYPGLDMMKNYDTDHQPVVIALRRYRLDIAKCVIEHGKHSAIVLKQALQAAIDMQYYDAVSWLVNMNQVEVNLNHLITAMNLGNAVIVDLLLNCATLIVDPFSQAVICAIKRAAEKGNRKVIECLVDKRLDVGVNLYAWSAYNGFKEIYEKLLKRDDFDSNVMIDEHDNLLIALIRNDLILAANRLLACRKEIFVNHLSRGEDTALMLSAKKSLQSTMIALLDHSDIEMDAKNHAGNTALHIAAESNFVAGVELLCKKGANPNIQNRNGQSPLIVALQNNYQKSDAMFALLKHSGTDLTIADNKGTTALMIAVAHGLITVVETLLQHSNCNFNAQDWDGDTALFYALRSCRNTDAEILITKLLSQGADLKIANHCGKTALMMAAEKGLPTIVNKLLQHDHLNINAQDSNGDTALILAARAHDNASIIKELLKYGADTQIENKSSYTALMAAKKAGHKALTPLLKGNAPDNKAHLLGSVEDPLPVASAPLLELDDTEGSPVTRNKNRFFAEYIARPATNSAQSREYELTQKPGM